MLPRKKINIQLINNYPENIFSIKPYKQMIERIISEKNVPVKLLNVIAVDDEYLRKLHYKYLNDNTYTDVMTFKLNESGNIEAEIYISIDRTKIQARQYKVKVEEEFARLVIHGLLHLKGYDDRTEADRRQMHQLENECLRKYWQSQAVR